MGRLAAWMLWVSLQVGALAAEPWQQALGEMPLPAGLRELNRTNCVRVVLQGLRSNNVVKGIVFMPGATDEFYMFRRARAQLAGGPQTLLDGVAALTNQTLIRATFRAPLLLLHTDEDPLEPIIQVEHEASATRLRAMPFQPYALYDDRDWDVLQPILQKTLKAEVRPWRHTYDSWHFYRHSFAGWNLSGWEALEAVALAGKTRITVRRKKGISFRPLLLVFEGDERVRATPKVEGFVR
jgi:hypothetical protein